MIKKFQEDRDVFLLCDFHGHSRKKNVFMYGCSNSKGTDILKEKILPNLLSKNCDIFSFPDSSFIIQKNKESTARVVAWKELNISNSYTLEASFCGADFGKFADYHFNIEMLEELGHQFCETIYDFCDPDQVKIKKSMEELEMLYPSKDPEEDAEGGANGNGSGGDSDFSGDEGEGKGKKKKKGKKKGKDKPQAAGNAKDTIAQLITVSAEDQSESYKKSGSKDKPMPK